MPLPLIPLVGAGVSLINTASQLGQNKKNREFAQHQYDQARADALADRAFENEYNSPAAQMERLKQAGLNPNLVYGSGGATVNSADTRSAPQNSPHSQAAQLSIEPIIQAVLLMAQKGKIEAETDNLKTAREVGQAEIGVKAAQQQQLIENAKKLSIESGILGLEKQLKTDTYEASVTAAKLKNEQTAAEIKKTQADTTFTLDQNDRAKLLTAQTLQKGVQEIIQAKLDIAKTRITNDILAATKPELIQRVKTELAKTQAELDNLITSGRLQQLDEDLKKRGIQPHDPAYMRAIMEALDASGITEFLRKMARVPKWGLEKTFSF